MKRAKPLQNIPRKVFPALFGMLLLLTGCLGAASSHSNPGQSSRTLTVFAAASLTEAFHQVGAAFEANHPGVEVTFNFAGSQQLAQQIAQGASVDVFASADRRQMEAAIQAGRVQPDQALPLAGNRLVVVLPAGNPAQLQTLQDLTRPGIKLVLAASQVPVGEYSLRFLDNADRSSLFAPGYKQAVLKNVVSYEENVRAVLSKVILGEADAGIVYTSDISSTDQKKVEQLDIPENLNVQASYWIAPVQNRAHPDLAEAFIAFARSSAGQEILSKYGFQAIQ